MVKKTKQSALDARIAKSKARKESRTADAESAGGGKVPAGIEGGIAKLTRVDFDIIKNGDSKGSQRLYLHGVCVEPKKVGKRKAEGLLVQPGQITLDDDTDYDGEERTFEENVAKAENRLKLVGFPTQDFDQMEEETLLYFEENKEEMFFEFHTWKPEDGDNVITMIDGPVDDYEDEDGGDDVEEEDEDDEEEEDEAPKPKPKSKKSKPKPKPEPEEEEEDEEEEDDAEEEDEDGEVDLTALGAAANEGDEEAQQQLSDMAEALGIDPEDDAYPDWTDVAAAVAEADSSDGGDEDDEDDEEEEEDDEDDVVPVKGESVGYKPPKARKVYEMTVLRVFKNGTSNLKNPANGKTYEKVSPTALVAV